VGVSACGAGQPAANQPANPQVQRAQELLQLLVDGKFDEFVGAGTETMRAAFSADQARQAWLTQLVQLGTFQSIESSDVTPGDKFASVRLVCRFSKGRLTMRIVLDGQNRLSGLWFDAVEPDWEPPTYVDARSFREEEVTVSAGQFPLPGTLTLPNQPGRHPAVVLVHGSGPNDRDETVGANKPFRDLAWGLASRGVAVLRYEKRTRAHPHACKVEDWTIENETIEDARAALALLRQRSDVDAKRVFMLGHSLGGWAAPLIAQREEQLAGVMMLAASARSILDLLEEQTDYTVSLAGAALTEEQRQQVGALKEAVAAIRAGKTDTVKEPIMGVPAVYWERLHRIDPLPVAAELQLPMLIAQGGRDYQVTGADYKLWKDRLRDHKHVTLKWYTSLNHLFVNGFGKSTPGEYLNPGHVAEEVVNDLAEWISKH